VVGRGFEALLDRGPIDPCVAQDQADERGGTERQVPPAELVELDPRARRARFDVDQVPAVTHRHTQLHRQWSARFDGAAGELGEDRLEEPLDVG